MKSSYDLAMERMGGTLRQLTEDQKRQIADLESLYKSKRAQAELSAQERTAKAQDVDTLNQIRQDLAVELASIESKLQREKDKVRG